jgi:CDP-6-deoxy-D-xylo-4-hexulose-3-dehydrase
VRPDAGFSRNQPVRFLEAHRVGTRLVFGGNLVRQPALRGVSFRVAGGLEQTDRVMRDSFWIGVWPGLGTPHLTYIVETFGRLVRELRG